MIILSPVGAYYPRGLEPARMHIEDVYARTVRGGTGEVKCGGNYAGSLASQVKAHDNGFEQTRCGSTATNVANISKKSEQATSSSRLTASLSPRRW